MPVKYLCFLTHTRVNSGRDFNFEIFNVECQFKYLLCMHKLESKFILEIDEDVDPSPSDSLQFSALRTLSGFLVLFRFWHHHPPPRP